MLVVSLFSLLDLFDILKRDLTEKVVHQVEMVNQVETAYRVEEEKMPVLKMLFVEKMDLTVLRKSIKMLAETLLL